MLPDLRVVTIAVISTFLFAVSVGFYTSSRLMSERKPRADSLAAIEDHPLNRIALNWPEPVQPPSESLNLDFAVTAKVVRNPVREVRDELPSVAPKVAAAPQETNQNSRSESPVVIIPKIDAPIVVASKVEAPKAELPRTEVPKVAAPKLELPAVEVAKVEAAKPELPPMAVTKAEAPKIEPLAPPPSAMPQLAKPEDNLPTASIVQAPARNPISEEPKPQPDLEVAPPAADIAALPEAIDPDAQAGPEIVAEPDAENSQAKPVKKKARKAKKKAAKKVVKPAPRPRLRPAVTSASNPFGFPFAGFQNQNQSFQNQSFQTR